MYKSLHKTKNMQNAFIRFLFILLAIWASLSLLSCSTPKQEKQSIDLNDMCNVDHWKCEATTRVIPSKAK